MFPAMHQFVRRSVALVACLAVVALAPGRVLAHTQLDFSLPADGTTVGNPVGEITVGFTDQVALVGNGFEVHDPQGNLLTPFIVTDDNKVYRFQLDPPLAGGVVVVDYHVKALDGDEQSGSFSFTVDAPVPTTAAPATSAPATPAPTSSPVTTSSTSTLPAVVAPEPTTATTTATTAPATTLPTTDSGSDSERTLMFAVLLGLAALAAGFLVIRSRRTA
jgi:methionine-rich copper-binding protein CopC